MRGQPKHYRKLAERTRQLAEGVDDQIAKEHLFDVSRQYDRLADEAERQSNADPKVI